MCMQDMKTGRSKCFAMLKMDSPEVVDTILKQHKHTIGGFNALVREFKAHHEHREVIRSIKEKDRTSNSVDNTEHDMPLD